MQAESNGRSVKSLAFSLTPVERASNQRENCYATSCLRMSVNPRIFNDRWGRAAFYLSTLSDGLAGYLADNQITSEERTRKSRTTIGGNYVGSLFRQGKRPYR
jgi:hypothetical protein